MKIKFRREYEIDFDGSARDFIILVHNSMRHSADSGLDSLDMGDAVVAACQLYDQGDLTSIVDLTGDDQYEYIDCPDKSTVLNDNFEVMYGSDHPNYKPPALRKFFNCCDHCMGDWSCPETKDKHREPCTQGCNSDEEKMYPDADDN